MITFSNIKTVNCSLKLIQLAIAEKWTKQLAFFHFLKSTYGNSTVFNYRSRMPEIALRFGVSTKTLYKYLAILKDNNLAYDFHDNLSLLSIRELKRIYRDKRKTKINIKSNDYLWQVECRLFAKIMEYHFKKMAFNEAVRRFGDRDRHKSELGESGFLPSLSIRNMAKLLNINEKTATKAIKTLELLEILKVIKPTVRKISSERLPVEILKDFPGYLFETKNGTFQMFGQSVVLKDYPVSLPRITNKVYVKYCKSI